MGRAKVHKLHDSEFRVEGDPVESQYHAICSVYQNAKINPKTTTWVDSEVTCGNCRKAILGVAYVDESVWWAHVDGQRSEGCTGPCDDLDFEKPVCRVCYACRACAGLHPYKQNRPGAPKPTKSGKCPGCKI